MTSPRDWADKLPDLSDQVDSETGFGVGAGQKPESHAPRLSFLRQSLKNLITPNQGVVIEGNGLYMRLPMMEDFQTWAYHRKNCRSYLKPWEPTWPADVFSRGNFRTRVRRADELAKAGEGYMFFIFRSDDDELLGGATLSNVRRGVVQSCSLGYWIAQSYSGNGYMSEAIRVLIRFVFEDLNLNRLEAYCMPSNMISRRVLVKSGFEEEGQAKKYRKINGKWEDHILYGMVNPFREY